jgi:hypothetical protein
MSLSRQRVRVSVTEDDIANGTPGSPCKCPIAIALKRIVKYPSIPQVGGEYVYGLRSLVELTLEARQFVAAFDKGFPVSPFDFDADIPIAAMTGLDSLAPPP